MKEQTCQAMYNDPEYQQDEQQEYDNHQSEEQEDGKK